MVAGFFSGRWVHCHDGEPEGPAKDVVFKLDNSNSLAMVGGIIMALGTALERAPARKVQYHILEPDPQPGSPGHFQLTVRNTVVYRCLDLPAVKSEPTNPEAGEPNLGLSQAHAASALPPSEWTTPLTDIR